MSELDHPCKNTCSGWKQGFERGKEILTEQLKACEAERDERKVELAAWQEIEKASGRTCREIYGMAYQLKPGKYGASPLPEIPSCSMSPRAIKMHDELCDILEARAFNEHDVCTASVGIWGAIALCEKAFASERDQLAERVRELEAELINKDALKQVKVLREALERYAHIPIANDERNASSAPSNQNFIAREALEKLKCT